MYTTGSSSLNQQPRQQINTPSLRVIMQEGLNRVVTTFPVITTDPTTENICNIRQTWMFKDKIFVSSNIVGTSWRPEFKSYDYQNATVYYAGSSFIPLDIFINGDTAVLYYTNTPGTSSWGVSTKLFRQFTSDGITFGGSQGILIGGSQIWDIACTSDSQLYTTTFLGNGNGNFPASAPTDRYAIWSISNNGAWGASILYSDDVFYTHLPNGTADYPNDYKFTSKTILAKKFGYVDRILQIGGHNISGDGLHVIETDGINIFSDNEIIDMNQKTDTRIIFGNYVGVSDIYYLPLIFVDDRYINSDGIGTSLRTPFGLHLMQSTDFINWSFPIYIGGSTFVDFLNDMKCGIISGGSLLSLFSIISTDTTRLDFYKSSNTIDISNDIIDYSNQNNERISITLGNLDNG